jgi:hypothetical protein
MHILFFRCCLIWKSLLYKTCSKSQDKEVTVYVVICNYLDPHYMSVALSFTHVRMYHNSWFLLNNSSCNKANHLKSIHQVRDNKRKTKFDFRLFDLFLSGVIPNETYSSLELYPMRLIPLWSYTQWDLFLSGVIPNETYSSLELYPMNCQ